jgi:hypothetical protein
MEALLPLILLGLIVCLFVRKKAAALLIPAVRLLFFIWHYRSNNSNWYRPTDIRFQVEELTSAIKY